MNDMKESAKRLLGPKGIRLASSVYNFGIKYHCEICGAHTRTRVDQGYGFANLEQLQVVGGLKRYHDVCPVCWANSRTRLLYLYLKYGSQLMSRQIDVLHFAPERGLAKVLSDTHGEGYFASDLDPSRYPLSMQIKSLNLLHLDEPDNRYDLVICSHVLEHIEEDLVAMGEILRILKPGGTALLQVPISLRLDRTREGIPAPTDDDRIRLYGQSDHIRIYTAPDYVERLTRTGFQVEQWWAYDALPEKAQEFRIDPFEQLFVCHKAAEK